METRLSVLHFEAGKHWTGGPVQVLNLHRSLCERGVASVLVAPSDSAILQRAKALKLPVAEIPYAGEADLLAPVRLARLIRQYRPSIVHLHSRRGAPLTGELAVRLAGRPRPKVVVHRRVDNMPSRNWITRWEFGGGCQHIIAISNKIYGVLRDYGVPEDKLSLIYSSVDLEAFPTPYSRQEVLDLLELPSSARVIGIVAQLIPRKGHLDLLEAFSGLAKEFPDVHLVACGRGPLRAELEAKVSKLHLEGRAHFAGFRQDLRKLLPNFEILAHPAHLEGLGVAVLEAMAAGVPVVAARAGGLPELVAHQVTGLLVEPGDVKGLREALRRLLADPQLGKGFAKAAKARVQREFSLEVMVEKTLALYHSLLKEGE